MKKLPPNAGRGRPKGSPNKVTKQLRQMIEGALDQAGGEDYLPAPSQEYNPRRPVSGGRASKGLGRTGRPRTSTHPRAAYWREWARPSAMGAGGSRPRVL